MDMPFRIENKESFRIAGYSIQTTNKRGEGKKAIPSFWTKFKTGNLEKPLLEAANREARGLFGICIYNTDQTDARRFEYMIGILCDCDAQGDVKVYTVPAMTWAVFPCTKETIGKTEVQAITKWLPKSKYRPLNKGYITGRMKSGAPDIEFYGKDGHIEVWVAVKEKG